MTLRCTRCNRKLTREPVNGMGPVCARAMLGAKPKRIRIADQRRRASDERQPDLFGEVRP